MKQLNRMTGETPLRGTAQRKLWILLSVALFALLTWAGPSRPLRWQSASSRNPAF